MSIEDHDQIIVLTNGDIIFNTEMHGLMLTKKSKISKDNEALSFADFEPVMNQPDRDNTALCLYANKKYNNPTIVY